MSRQVSSSTFLGLESCHVFVTGAAGGVGGAVVQEFLGKLSISEDQIRSL